MLRDDISSKVYKLHRSARGALASPQKPGAGTANEDRAQRHAQHRPPHQLVSLGGEKAHKTEELAAAELGLDLGF